MVSVLSLTNIDYLKIQFKQPNITQINGLQYQFIPLRYGGKEILIKSPRMITPLGALKYDNNQNVYCSISFTDSDIDQNIMQFLTFIQKLETYVCQCVDTNNHTFKSCLKKHNEVYYMKLKVDDNSTEIYDEHNHLSQSDIIQKYSYIMSLLQIANIWASPTEYGISWKVLQIRVFPPEKLFGGVSLLDDFTPITPPLTLPPLPPPLPPPPSPSELMNAKCMSLCDMINGGGYALKSVDTKSNQKGNQTLGPLKIGLNDVLSMRGKLKKTGLLPV